mgnify:CR=1 FL=1
MSRAADERDLRRFCKAVDRAFANALSKPIMAMKARLEERGYEFHLDMSFTVSGGPDRSRPRPRGPLTPKIGTADRAFLQSMKIAPP